MSELPDTTCFEGALRDGSAATFASQAFFHGCISITAWRSDEVQRLLPEPLVLAENRSRSPDLHPVAFLFGEQRYGATIFGGLTLPTPIVYQEFTMAVPFVRHRGGRFLHTFLPRMVCSYFPATWVGNTHYGFGKRMGQMRWEGRIFAVCDATGELWLHAHVEELPPSAATARSFERARALFALPVVGIRSDGRHVSSYWDFDVRAAQVRPVDAMVTIDAPFATGLLPGEHADVPGGSFAVDGLVWRLSWPGHCQF